MWVFRRITITITESSIILNGKMKCGKFWSHWQKLFSITKDKSYENVTKILDFCSPRLNAH